MGKHQHYRCYFGGACHIDLRTRSRCKACRFKKCLEEGMSVEAIRLGRTPKIFKPYHTLAHGNFGSTPRIAVQASPTEQSPYGDQADARLANFVAKDRTPSSASVSPHSLLISNGLQWRTKLTTVNSNIADEPLSRILDFDPNEIRADISSIISFSDESLNFMLNDFISDFMERPMFRPALIPDIKLRDFPNPTAGRIVQPSVLHKYWGVMRARNSVLEDSVKAVTDAMESVFGEDMRHNELYVKKFHAEGQVPHQPQSTLVQMLTYVQESVATMAERLFRFLVLIPGFTDLGQNDRTSIVRDRWYVAWLITHAHCYINEECYHPIGPFALHYCRYWMRQMLDANFVRFIFSVTADINDLELNKVETYMLLVVALLRTDAVDSLEDKGYIDFLYTHYLDGLIHLIGPGRGDLLMRLRAVVGRFSVVNEVHRRFILQASLDQAPLGGTWDSDEMASVTLKASSEGFVPSSPSDSTGS